VLSEGSQTPEGGCSATDGVDMKLTAAIWIPPTLLAC